MNSIKKTTGNGKDSKLIMNVKIKNKMKNTHKTYNKKVNIFFNIKRYTS